MINKEELLLTVDEENNPIEPLPRHVAHANGTWHRTTGVWVINRNKQVLCQKRSMKKDVKPGMWEAFFGGHLSPGQEYLDGAANEVCEELGVQIEKKDLIPYRVFRGNKPTHKEFQHVFALILDTDSNTFQIEKDEIDEVKWITLGEVRKILVKDKNPGWVIKPWDAEVLSWLEAL